MVRPALIVVTKVRRCSGHNSKNYSSPEPAGISRVQFNLFHVTRFIMGRLGHASSFVVVSQPATLCVLSVLPFFFNGI